MNIKKIIRGIIVAAAILAMLYIWPFGGIRYTCEVRGYPEEFQYSLELVSGNTVQQYFVPQYDEIESVVVYFTNLPENGQEGVMHLNLLDEAGELLSHDAIAFSDLADGYNAFQVSCKVVAGKTYSFYIYSEIATNDPEVEIAPKLVYRSLSQSGPTENGTFLMNGTVFEDCSAAGGYDYGRHLRVSQILCYDFFILFLAAFLYDLFMKVLTKKKRV